MGTAVETTLDGAVFTITLIDEANRNALSSALVTEFHTALDLAEADEAVRVVVVTNTGSVFCAGASLSERTTDDPAPLEADPARLFARILRSPKPFVGKIAGHAVAGGTGLAASMDISVAIEDARFGFTEVRLGLAPAIISVICLPKMRRADAGDAFLRGRQFDAREAARLGLINQAVPADDLDERIGEIVADLLLGGPKALAAAKHILRRVPAMDVDEAMSEMAQLSAELFGSEEGQAGMSAYLAKRPAPWAPASD
ncbi:MAG: enoyl-CoA hydratase/isomerase family protein [Acidimicrobiia bacterium]|nr:enoyl-CoA hydratase/isomerase family protein [Acidimicrobiia bacterium]MBT8249332.1 enoyl-CoA hydratase/isomerase family protein [Acidimicrobiia bacterium]NNL27505.1 enoyl-CoA hydratase [Acidimicrobiia bacterium]